MIGEQVPAGPAPLRGPPDGDGAPCSRIPLRGYLVAAGALTIGIFAGFSIASESIPPASAIKAADISQEPTRHTVPGDGIFLVGLDVRPGLYRSLSNSDRCTWTRSKDATGERSSVRAHDTSQGSAYVDLVAGDFFDTTDCNTWQRVSAPTS